MIPIRFAPGATSAVVSGDLPARSTVRYILRALAGQLMDVTLSAPEGVKVSVTNLGGMPLTVLTSSPTSFRGYLPRTGEYIITVASGSQAASYSVNVSIPKRIAFVPGTTSSTLTGHLAPHQSLDYILRAQAGQLMEITATPESSLQLIIYGVDGTVLRSGMGEGSSFRGELPISQDYIVTLRAGDQAVSFTMNVIIPQRIRFASGAVSASLRGVLGSHQTHYYVLGARQNQTMQARVSPADKAQLIIYGMDGAVLSSGMGEAAMYAGKLPSTQDYIVAIRAGPDPVVYSFQVTIR